MRNFCTRFYLFRFDKFPGRNLCTWFYLFCFDKFPGHNSCMIFGLLHLGTYLPHISGIPHFFCTYLPYKMLLTHLAVEELKALQSMCRSISSSAVE